MNIITKQCDYCLNIIEAKAEEGFKPSVAFIGLPLNDGSIEGGIVCPTCAEKYFGINIIWEDYCLKI